MNNTVWMILQSLVNGVMMGGVYALISVGLTIIFGVMKVVNFAQGEYLVIGMYVTLVLSRLTGLEPYYLLGPVIIIAYGIRPHLELPDGRAAELLGQNGSALHHRDDGAVVSYFEKACCSSFLRQTISRSNPATRPRPSSWGASTLATPKVFAFLAMFVFVCLVNYFLKRTDLGRSMRATSENTMVAQSLGIDTTRIYGFSFALGTTFAAITGLFLTPIYLVYPTVGTTFKSIAMVVIVDGRPRQHRRRGGQRPAVRHCGGAGGHVRVERPVAGGGVSAADPDFDVQAPGSVWERSENGMTRYSKRKNGPSPRACYVLLVVLLAAYPQLVSTNYYVSVGVSFLVFAALGSCWNIIGGFRRADVLVHGVVHGHRLVYRLYPR